MKCFFVISGLLFSQLVNAQQWPVAVINDPDGFVFVRSGPGKENPVIDTIAENTFFFCAGDTSKFWIYIQNPVDGKTGYMHRSRITFFYQLNSTKQHKLILNAFTEIVVVTNAYYRSKEAYDSKEKRALNKKRGEVYEAKYAPACIAFGEHFSMHPDSVLLVAFFKTLNPLSGSADEGIPSTCASCWLSHPAFVENIVCHWKNEHERLTIISSVETGIALGGFKIGPEKSPGMYTKLRMKCN